MFGKALWIGVWVFLFECICFYFLLVVEGTSGALEMGPLFATFFLTAVIATCTAVIVEAIKNNNNNNDDKIS